MTSGDTRRNTSDAQDHHSEDGDTSDEEANGQNNGEDGDEEEDETEEDEEAEEEDEEAAQERRRDHWRNRANDAAGWRRRCYIWEYDACHRSDEKSTGFISNDCWACGVESNDVYGLSRPDSSARLDNRFQRDVFFFARSFIGLDWPWRLRNSATRSWRELDTDSMAADYRRLFESDLERFELSETARSKPYAFALAHDERWLCPPALTELFGEIFADQGEKPDAAQAAARIRTIVERYRVEFSMRRSGGELC